MSSTVSCQGKRIAVHVTGYGGHHLRYVALMVDALAPCSAEVRLFGEERARSRAEYGLFLKEREGDFEWESVPTPASHRGSRRLGTIRRLLGILCSGRFTDVLISSFDAVFPLGGLPLVLTRLFGCAASRRHAVLVNTGFVHQAGLRDFRSLAKRLLLSLFMRLRMLDSLYVVDTLAYEALARQLSRHGMLLAPDPVGSTIDVRDRDTRCELGMPARARVLGAFGLLTRGKGIDSLVQAFARRGPPPGDHLLLMGPLSVDLERILQDEGDAMPRPGWLTVVNRYVSEGEMRAAMACVDAVSVAYPQHLASASFLLWACAMGKPVLGSTRGWIGEMMRRYRLGVACDASSVSALQGAIGRVLQGEGHDPGDSRRLAHQHTSSRFQAAIRRGIAG